MDLKKKTKEFLEENPTIKEALRIFQISEEQYKKALQSLHSGTFTSDTTNSTTETEAQWTNQ
ncbi:MAG: hypothetical protein WBW16_04570 [Bacteroidota bacterium]